MAEPVTPDPQAQQTIELPDGVVLSGVGGDTEALRIQFEERADERDENRAPVQAEPVVTPQQQGAKTRGKKRFDQLTAEREEANRRADAAEAKAKELEAKLAAPPTVIAPPAIAPATREDLTPASTVTARAKPTEAEVGTKYPAYSDFVEDLADWKAEQRELKLVATLDARSTARIEADRASRNRAETAGKMMAAGRTAYPDFDAVIQSRNAQPVSYLHHDAILKLGKNSEHVLYAVCKDNATFDRITQINDPVLLGVELAQLIPRESVAPPASTAPVVRTTNAPAPIQPVGASTRTTSPTIEELANKGEYEAYKAARSAARRA